MTALAGLADLIGEWRGTNHLWLSPQDPVHQSKSCAVIKNIAHDQFTEICYTWADEEKPQEGMLILGQEPESEVVNAVWFDTWHMINTFMVCQGTVETNGTARVNGFYAAPPGPDWGWQITIEPQDQNSFRFRMHNISPEDKKMLAVEVEYSRQI